MSREVPTTEFLISDTYFSILDLLIFTNYNSLEKFPILFIYFVHLSIYFLVHINHGYFKVFASFTCRSTFIYIFDFTHMLV